MESVIYDYNELEGFLKLLKPLKSYEVFYAVLAARNKYLDPDERKTYKLNDTHFLTRKIIKKNDLDYFVGKIEEFDYRLTSFKSNGLIVPTKAFVSYFSVNPKSTYLAFLNLQNTFGKHSNEYISRGNVDVLVKFKNIENELMTAIQASNSYTYWIDVDIDIKEKDLDFLKTNFLNLLDEKRTSYFVVETKSGYHVLLERLTLNFNYPLAVAELDKKIKNLYGKEKSEAKVNDNALIPLPGTMQADFPVKIILKNF